MHVSSHPAIIRCLPDSPKPVSPKPDSPKYIQIYPCHDLDLSRLRDVIGHVTINFDSPCVISCKCSIVTESLSLAIFEIMGPKHIWVTILTFLGHVTSSVTWPIDPPCVISYWCPIGTAGRYSRHNQVFQICWRSVKGFSYGWGSSNFAIDLDGRPLQHSHTTVWACDHGYF